MPDLNIRDMPTRELFAEYQERYKNINADTALAYLDFEKTSSRAAQMVDRFLESESLTETRFICLMLLYRQVSEPMKPSELAHGAGVKRGTITGVIDGLARSGWVDKVKDEHDGRSVKVSINHAGVTKLERILPRIYQLDNDIMAGISSQDFEAFSKILALINKNLDNME